MAAIIVLIIRSAVPIFFVITVVVGVWNFCDQNESQKLTTRVFINYTILDPQKGSFSDVGHWASRLLLPWPSSRAHFLPQRHRKENQLEMGFVRACGHNLHGGIDVFKATPCGNVPPSGTFLKKMFP
jgi:hypothetical protein